MKFIIGIAFVGLIACSDTRFMRVGVEPSSAGGIPGFQQVDDSVRLYASEWKHDLFGDAEPSMAPSEESPESYEWSSSNPAVAEVRSSGWMITHTPGQVLISVRASASAYSQSVAVCSRDTRLAIDPRDPFLQLHDTMVVTISLRQPGGADCGHLDFGPFAPQQRTGTQALEPIFSLPHHWRAIRTGAYWYTSSVMFAGHTVQDSILVTIR